MSGTTAALLSYSPITDDKFLASIKEVAKKSNLLARSLARLLCSCIAQSQHRGLIGDRKSTWKVKKRCRTTIAAEGSLGRTNYRFLAHLSSYSFWLLIVFFLRVPHRK
jgi:hypothetical protein